ncbi:MAG: hypothetical protein UV67_C0014G0011 [Parcubacteria group bacterium GW2011_GWC1_43_12]|nr:MAG: hypothetical protein UV34_C0014G0011 [Parcubacteria group bacterium GW2011_GWB1_42_6]KKS91950.1 MAG: hypothetical protein UV67_C0014G0011 [Parcubacteria group bacterium GW2011_GWC1_43_12]
MSKRQVVGSMSEWSGVLKDFFRQIDDGSKTLRQVQLFNEGKNPFVETANIDSFAEWNLFYRENWQSLGLSAEPDLSGLAIPEHRKGFDRLIVVAKGLTPQKLFDACAGLFPCWKWTDKSLDDVIDFSFQARNPQNGSYAIRVRDRIEADKELKNRSADDLAQGNISAISLAERLLYELKFFRETRKHLDIQNITLCSGSRYLDGHVPRVRWYGGRLLVHWSFPGDSSGSLRSRQIVS